MAQIEQTSEYRLGKATEQVVREYFRLRGYYVFPEGVMRDGGAPLLVGEIKKNVSLDLQIAKRGETRLVEVKYKNRPTLTQRTGRFEHGIDLPNWFDYLRVMDETGLGADLAIVQWRPGTNSPPAPILMLADFSLLRQHVRTWSGSTSAIPHGMAFFETDLFEWYWGIDEYLRSLVPLNPRVIRPWERGRQLGARQLYFNFARR